MIEPAPLRAGDVLDWLHEQGKQRAQAVPEFDVEGILCRVRAESQLRANEQDQPTVRRLVVGRHLRRLREDASVTVEQAAAAIRGSHSKICRMEQGRVRFRERDIADLLALYGVTGGEKREALLKLARETGPQGWWEVYSDTLPHWMKPYLGLEASAASIRNYEVQFVPVLLQTDSYARALLRPGSTTEDEARCRAEVRLHRQEILRRDAPPRLWAIVDEGALRRLVGGKTVMREQIRHLINMCDHPAVKLQILPFQAVSHPSTCGPFTILRFSDSDLPDVVYTEQLTGAIYLNKPADVDYYREMLDWLCLQASPSANTWEILTNILAEI